ncbi:hypothetical protein niasHT_009594 [Heterodera trifolii]|uniref:Uncharacterized protein n=1 Tax=Heterodera trifolii TaxID=157864 RepID=A0ABD2M6J8_9BILA
MYSNKTNRTYDIEALQLYDYGPCQTCGRIRHWHLVRFTEWQKVTTFGKGVLLLDESHLCESGSLQNGLWRAISERAVFGGKIQMEVAKKIVCVLDENDGTHLLGIDENGVLVNISEVAPIIHHPMPVNNTQHFEDLSDDFNDMPPGDDLGAEITLGQNGLDMEDHTANNTLLVSILDTPQTQPPPHSSNPHHLNIALRRPSPFVGPSSVVTSNSNRSATPRRLHCDTLHVREAYTQMLARHGQSSTQSEENHSRSESRASSASSATTTSSMASRSTGGGRKRKSTAQKDMEKIFKLQKNNFECRPNCDDCKQILQQKLS